MRVRLMYSPCDYAKSYSYNMADNAASNKQDEFWQCAPLPIHLYSPEVAYQKLDYLHQNPTAKHWQLVDEYINYK